MMLLKKQKQSTEIHVQKIGLLSLFFGFFMLIAIKPVAAQDHYLYFDGSNDYVALQMSYQGLYSVPYVSVEAWVRTTYTGGGYNGNWSIVDFDRSDFYNLYVRGDNGRVGFSTDGGNTHDFTGSTVVNDGQWHHIAAIYDGTNKYIYVDGVLDATHNNSHGGKGLGTNARRYGFIGDGSEATSYNGSKNNVFYKGDVSELRIWHRVLSGEEIAANKAAGSLIGTETGLAAYYTFDDGLATDLTGNGHGGGLFNGPLFKNTDGVPGDDNGGGNGENPDLSTVAGVGLTWDATTQKLNVDNSTINLWNENRNNNVFIGLGVGQSSGANNTVIGDGAGNKNTSGAGNIFLGKDAGYNETGSNKLYIDNSNTSTPLIYGDFSTDVLTFNGKVGIGTNAPAEALEVNGLMKIGVANNENNNSPGIVAFSNDNFLYDEQYLNHYGIGFHTYQDDSFLPVTNPTNMYMSSYFGMDFFTGGANRMRINANGFVGIGTTSPSEALEVNGLIKIGQATTEDDNSPGLTAFSNDDFLYDGQYINHYGFGFHSYQDGGDTSATNPQNAYMSGYFGMDFFTGGTPRMRINHNGNVGIGKSNPTKKLDVTGDINFTGNLYKNGTVVNLDASPWTTTGSDISFNGNIGIGTTTIPSDYKLAVAGKVITEEVKVQLQSSWPDYVFEKDYHLPSLEEVASHIQEKGHLQNIPSAEVVKKEGIFLGDMNAKLLQKIEELTLYTIQQEKKIQEQEARNKVQAEKSKALEARLQRLEQWIQSNK